MRYAVTGATGFVGGALVDLLLAEGHEVVALVRSPERARDLESRGVELVAGDITDRESVRPAFEGADGVFHLAAWYEVGPADPSEMAAINVGGTRNVLELVDELDVPKAVYTSSLAVFSDTDGQVPDEGYRYDGPHLTEYDRTKWAAHHEVAEPMAREGTPVVTVMPGAVYGPGDPSSVGDALRDYLAGDLPVVPYRTGLCWGHVEDTARAHLAAMDRGTPGETYIVAGEPHTLVEVLATAERLTGIPAPRAVPPWTFAVLSRVAGLLERAVTLPKDYRAESLRVLAGPTYYGDNTKAERELGLVHRPLETGLAETLGHEMAELGMDPEEATVTP